MNKALIDPDVGIFIMVLGQLPPRKIATRKIVPSP